ncbi:hypothetical protein CC78DRAFT_591780 [Lojkania enalia]|uniref:NACHT domain-containing protein n=1 Tax=Lojkania enalia TaxID=147567 RepID=A0A9P4MVZ2_9PLEO|nr:hypothetical protein CC78DRAFT_591780 [Didymosphaeria enalia]
MGNNIYHSIEAKHSPTEECLKSLAFLEMNDRPNDIDRAAIGMSKGTCTWLLGHKTYRKWVSHHRGLIWIKGKPGSGKSTLLRYALRNVQVEHEAGDRALILSFFFHGRSSELQRTPLGLFRSLLHQLLSHIPDLLSDIVDLFKSRQSSIGAFGEKWHWHPQELQGFFESALPKILDKRPIKLFVDALDECGEENATRLVDSFKELVQKLPSTLFQLSICFTCRHYPILAFDDQLSICVEDENIEDIAVYVRERLSFLRIPSKLVIQNEITTRASGVFLWAYLVVKRVLELDRRGIGLQCMYLEIQHLPPDLDDLYQELLQIMDEIPASLKLMQWICFATKPLSIEELRWAMVVDADCPHRTLQQCQSAEDYIYDNERMERRTKTLSCGLAEANDPILGSWIVQFIHQSVKDFFVGKGLSTLYAALNSPKLADLNAHYRLSRSCICYLAMKEITQLVAADRQSLVSEFPLLSYATRSWVKHVKKSETEDVSQADLLDYFAWPSEHLIQVWIRIYQKIHPHLTRQLKAGAGLLHIASRYNLIQLLLAILQSVDRLRVKIDCRDASGRTPLSWATEYGHEAIVKLLLGTGEVDIDSKNVNSRTPLLWAAEYGHEVIVKLLLSTGEVDIDSKNTNNRAPISWAAEYGHKGIVKLLLSTGKVDVNSKDTKYGRAPLSWAAENGHEAIVKLLQAR